MDSKDEKRLALEQRLKPQHLAFARGLVAGESLKNAYQDVYSCNPTSAASAGCRLFGRSNDIRDYYSLCTGLASDNALTTRAAILTRLLEIGDNVDPKAQGAAVAALKEVLSQMDHAAPMRVEVSGPRGEPIQTEDKTRGLKTETVVHLAAQLFGVSEEKAIEMFRKGSVSG